MDSSGRNQAGKRHGWRVFPLVVIGLIGARQIAHALIAQTFNGLSDATKTLLETVVVGIMFALVGWRAVVLPLRRRHERLRVAVAAVTQPQPTLVRGQAMGHAPGRSRAIRHLTLVPPLPDSVADGTAEMPRRRAAGRR